MARKIEYIKRQEARIITYLMTAIKPLRKGKAISSTLNIDYVYTMKLMERMYQKGWIKTYIYDRTTYFSITLHTPTEEVKKVMSKGQEQMMLNGNNNRNTKV